jgi:V-type H+-transporting ATPase 16kDa proteolipid subunit
MMSGRQRAYQYGYNSGFMHLGCGIAVGMTGLAAGYCIGVVGDKGVRAYMEQSRVFVGMVLILIFGEVLGLYGYVFVTVYPAQISYKLLISQPCSLIVALILNTKSRG